MRKGRDGEENGGGGGKNNGENSSPLTSLPVDCLTATGYSIVCGFIISRL